MSDQPWPDEAREAVARAVATRCGEYTDVPVPSECYVDADAVLAALSVHAVPRAAVLGLAQQLQRRGDFGRDDTDYLMGRSDGHREAAEQLRGLLQTGDVGDDSSSTVTRGPKT